MLSGGLTNLTQPKCLSVCICLLQKMSICLKSCLDIFLACLLFCQAKGCLTACQQLLSIGAQLKLTSVVCVSVTAQESRNASLTWHHVSLSTEAHHQHCAIAKPWQCTCFPISHPPPFVAMYSDRWRAKQGWDGDVMVWRSGKCKFASERSFFQGVKMMGCGYGARARAKVVWCQVKCKLYCNSRTVMPKIIIISSLSAVKLDGTYYQFGHI